MGAWTGMTLGLSPHPAVTGLRLNSALAVSKRQPAAASQSTPELEGMWRLPGGGLGCW